jgi:hypothetical protein
MAVMDLKIGENGMRFGVLYSTAWATAGDSELVFNSVSAINHGHSIGPCRYRRLLFQSWCTCRVIFVPHSPRKVRRTPGKCWSPCCYCTVYCFAHSRGHQSTPHVHSSNWIDSEQWILKNVTCEFVVSDILHVVSRDKMVSFNRGVPERAKVEPIPKERTVMSADSDRKTDFEPYSMQSFTGQTNWTGYWGTNRSTGSK